MTTGQRASAWWETWSKAIAAAAVGVIIGAGSLALAIAPMVNQHEKQIANQAVQIIVLSDKVNSVAENVAVTRAVVERLEKRADSGR